MKLRIHGVWIVMVILLLAGCAPVKLQFPVSPEGSALDGQLLKPDGTGPFPAVVLLHTCGGLHNHVYSWADRLRNAGYVVQIVDSLSRRKAHDNCRTLQVSVDTFAQDALDALAHLRKLPFADASRMAVIGFSYGGMAALRLASAGYAKSASPLPGFRAAIAFYPHCTARETRHSHVQDNLYNDISVPLLLLLGGRDAEAPAALCADKADALRRAGQPVSYKIYAEATHGFDRGGRGWQGDAYFYDMAATDDAWNEMKAFLQRHLR